MKASTKYVQLLEEEVKFLREQLRLVRKDLDLAYSKAERIELALMQPWAPKIEIPPPLPRPTIKERLRTAPTKMPFSDLKERWNRLTAEEQEKAMNEGWKVDEEPKENTDAGI